MPYLTQQDLVTHVYPEIVTEIIRDYKTEYSNVSAFPPFGITGRQYISIADNKVYKWNGDTYVETQPVDIVAKAIKSAIAEIKSYLSRYDLFKLFGTDDTPEEVEDEHLKDKAKDVACWKLVRLAQPNIDLALFRTIYEDAIAWLKLVQSGKADPEGWPYRADDPETEFNESSTIQWKSNPKRGQSY